MEFYSHELLRIAIFNIGLLAQVYTHKPLHIVFFNSANAKFCLHCIQTQIFFEIAINKIGMKNYSTNLFAISNMR